MISRLVWIILRLNGVEALPLHELDNTFRNLPIKPQNAYNRLLDILLATDPAHTLAPLETLVRNTEMLVQANE